ncbi:osmotically inducible protein OsmC [Taibaiella sp. KBW10]|uniref:OsmC family protein n=1 Tax=Taibaiella sp. KBW10 TaxID=2153357 RepID=UPI000F5B68D6|nr:OsmC family protein [Taibaiella sp. KBW10]RQO30634.1 osmotically inducible protein OsmC [Taibaiella sp. KBW10]
MSIKVAAVIGTDLYLTEISSGEKRIIGDEPVDQGGQDKGFNPYELLAASLASCTCATLRMYVNRKQWAVSQIATEVTLERDPDTQSTHFERIISFEGALSEEQLQRLLTIANACPIHKILSGTIEIKTRL